MPNRTLFTYITLFLTLCIAAVNAQQLSIKGSAPVFKNATLYLCVVDDYINGHEVAIDSTTVSAKGEFSFKPILAKTQYGFIKNGGLVYDLYLEPGKALEITIPDTAGFVADSVLNPVQILNPQAGELNTLIRKFDATYNDFLIANYKLFLRKTGQKATATFITTLQPMFAGISNAYFTNYVFYRIASLELLASVKPRKVILEEYFKDKPVLYTNDAYMGLFNEVFEKNLKIFRSTKAGENMDYAINKSGDFDKVMDVMRRDSIIPNDTLRELALIKGLGEAFYTPAMVQNNILALLKHAAVYALTLQNRLAAQHLTTQLEKLRQGTPAPPFTLRNIVTGENVSLSDFKGKIVYLSFWDETNTHSLNEVDLIKELEKAYGKKVAFITIGNSPNEVKTQGYINRNKYKWIFLNSRGSTKLLENYDVLSYPSFYLIDEKGNILKSPADRPSGNITRTFEELLKKK